MPEAAYQPIIATSAIFDKSGRYRYQLNRTWRSGEGTVVLLMLNPSTADATSNDPTITRCIHLAQSKGFKSLTVVNLFAFRATEPKDLRLSQRPVGKENDKYVLEAVSSASHTIAAWGNHGQFMERDKQILSLLSDFNFSCLGINNTGQPKHPLYVRSDQPLLPYQS